MLPNLKYWFFLKLCGWNSCSRRLLGPPINPRQGRLICVDSPHEVLQHPFHQCDITRLAPGCRRRPCPGPTPELPTGIGSAPTSMETHSRGAEAYG
jgi:hypothetical protein